MPLAVQAARAAGKPILKAGYAALALQMQEAAGDLSNSDVRSRLSGAIQDAHAGTGTYAYYLDHFGDDSDGDVAYNCGGDTYMAPYEISGGDGTAAAANIDLENRRKVIPRITYDEVGDDDEADGYARMSEAWKRDAIYGDVPTFERFVSKAERDKMDESDFAGKGKSFPINKPADVMAAVHAMGRAGSGNYGPAMLKANIIRIAKKKGWGKYLPAAWQGGDAAKESAAVTGGALRLVESAGAIGEIVVRESEAPAEYPIKLIAPGKGAMAYYPADVLKRDGPSVFGAGTRVYLNHPAGAEESEAPGNRDVNRLAGVLTKPAEWQENGPKGPGLYGKFKVFADHAGQLAEKAKYLAMSIMASGEQAVEEGKRVFREGLPVLARLTRGDSVDIVPIAGAGGMILTEAARAASGNEGAAMTEAEKTQLQEALRVNAQLLGRALRSDAITEGARVLQDLALPASIKTLVVENVVDKPLPTTAAGALDSVKLSEAIMSEARRLGAAFTEATGAGQIRGLGGQAAATIDPAVVQAQEAAMKMQESEEKQIWASLMPGAPESAIERARKGRAA